jgi:hypothetical protein
VGTEEDWQILNNTNKEFKLQRGEVGIVFPNEVNEGAVENIYPASIKIGDGIHDWNSLPCQLVGMHENSNEIFNSYYGENKNIAKMMAFKIVDAKTNGTNGTGYFDIKTNKTVEIRKNKPPIQ